MIIKNIEVTDAYGTLSDFGIFAGSLESAN